MHLIEHISLYFRVFTVYTASFNSLSKFKNCKITDLANLGLSVLLLQTSRTVPDFPMYQSFKALQQFGEYP